MAARGGCRRDARGRRNDAARERYCRYGRYGRYGRGRYGTRSDGCAGQFKQKAECWFLIKLKNAGLEVSHHFFQSCHGKGPSDSEGAVIKCGLRAAELQTSHFADSAAAFDWLVERLSIKRGSVSATGKRRHTIGARDFAFVKVTTRPNMRSVETSVV